MKKQSILLGLLIISSSLFANDEHLCVITGSGEKCTVNNLGPVPPCGDLAFIAKGTPPSGGVFAKFEWYVNGVLVKISTNPGDPGLIVKPTTRNLTVNCAISYQTSGIISGPFSTGDFKPIVQEVNVGEIVMSTLAPVYGCTNTVSFSLNSFICTGPSTICDLIANIGSSYTISWEPPTGWTQTSIDARGNSVSFQPDATGEGTLTATIHLSCGYTETRIYVVHRTAPATDFSTSNYVFCSSPGEVTVGSMCGASDYTYTIIGYPGVTFAANGLTTYTTSATTVNVNVPSGSTANAIKVKANYPGSHPSLEVTSTINTGPPLVYNSYFQTLKHTFTINEWTGGPGNENEFCYYGVPTGVTTNMNFLGSGSVEWERISPASNVGIVWSQDGDNLVMAFKSKVFQYVFRVTITNACGPASADYKFVGVDCGFAFRVSPNPASNILQVSLGNSSTEGTRQMLAKDRSISIVQVFDLQGNLKKLFRFNHVKHASLDMSQLPRGMYLIEVGNGQYKERQQIFIQR